MSILGPTPTSKPLLGSTYALRSTMDIEFRVPAQVHALVTPLGKIRPSTFKQYFERLQSVNEVRLVDLRTDDKHQDQSSNIFHPKSYPSGRVLYNFTLKPTSKTEQSLFDLEIWRANLLVLGVAHYSDASTLEEELKSLRARYKTMTSCQILVFGTPEDHNLELGSHIIPVLASNYTSLEAAICDVTSNLFNSLNALAISKQMGSFKSPSFKALDLPDQHSMATPTKPNKRRHMPRISSMSISRSGSISMNVTERAKARQKGRSLKFMGNLYLLTGRLPSALDTFTEAATTLKNSHDHLWFASCLESIGVCLLLQAFYDMPVTIPTIAINTVEGETESFVARYSRSSQHQKLSEFFPGLLDTILRYYDRCNPESEEAVPRIVYNQTILRYASLLAKLRRGGGWNGASLSAIIRNTELSMNVTEQSPTAQEIEEWCQIVSQNSTNVNSDTEWTELRALMSIYSCAGLGRKWAFQVQQFVLMLATQGESAIVKQFPQELLEALFHQLSNFYTHPKMKLSCVRAFMNLATRIGNLKFVALASGIMLANGTDILSKEEQLSLYQVVKDDGEINHGFCNPSLLQQIKLTSITNNSQARRVPTEQQYQGQTQGQAPQQGHIIYNPYDQEGETPSLIQNDPTPVKVYLKNPFAFELHITEIYIVDDKSNKISRSNKDVVLPPRDEHCVVIDLVPPSPGNLVIAGCWVQIGGSPAQVFSLSSSSNLEVKVLSARPSLALRKTSFSNGWAMLLEGEKCKFNVEISNTSSTASSELQFGFSDSTIEPLRQAIAKSDTTRAELYELEYFLHERKAVELLSVPQTIDAHSSGKFEFQLNGKRGVSNATILADSGNDPSTRIRIPLNVTVYPSIEMDGIEIIQLSKNSAMKGDLLVLLSLRNSWREALDVTVWTSEKNTTTARIESMRTQRVVISIDWPFIPSEELSKPIPSILNKQYVLDTKTTPEMLKMFWLREKLLAQLKGRWSSVNCERQGEIEMRGIQLNKRLVNVLSTPSIQLDMWVESESVNVDEMFVLVTKAQNRSDQDHSGMLRIVSDKPNSSIVAGNLQLPVVIPANESIVVKTKAMPLCAGTVEWSSLVDLIGSTPCFQRSPLVIVAK